MTRLPTNYFKYSFVDDRIEVDKIKGKPYGITLHRRGRKTLFIAGVIVEEMMHKYKDL